MQIILYIPHYMFFMYLITLILNINKDGGGK
jgi:hypothetical protein